MTHGANAQNTTKKVAYPNLNNTNASMDRSMI